MMKKLGLLLSAATVAVAILLASKDAHALGPVDLEIAAIGGFGSNPTGYAPNPMSLGVGGRAGVSFFGLYGGLKFLYYVGGSAPSVDSEGSPTTQTWHSVQYGAELGYGFRLPLVHLVIRPQVGLGNWQASVNCDQDEQCNVPSAFYLEPGVLAEFTFGHLLVGADVNAFILPSVAADDGHTTDVAFTAHAQVGVRF
jgi:hypothetical protein